MDSKTTIIVSEPTDLRRSFALKHGATLALEPSASDIVASTLEATNGKGVDVSFEAAGTQGTLDAAILSCRARGRVVVVAGWEKPPTVDMNLVLLREISITGEDALGFIQSEILSSI